MIQINSELPIKMLDRNLMLNDYDFVLFHLFENNEDYRKYFLNLRATRPDRKMILDNSAYELFINGQELDMDAYVDAIRFLDPDYYILPDTLMDKDKTINSVKEFLDKYNNILNCFEGYNIPIAVLQGNTPEELLECAVEYSEMGITHIAIPFHNSFFKDLGNEYSEYLDERFKKTYDIEELTDDMKYAKGRYMFLYKCAEILKEFDYVHLLGSHCPLEKALYERSEVFEFINSMDTGYPVKCAIEGYELYKEPHKPNIIIDDFINNDITFKVKRLIMDNIWKIRKNVMAKIESPIIEKNETEQNEVLEDVTDVEEIKENPKESEDEFEEVK